MSGLKAAVEKDSGGMGDGDIWLVRCDCVWFSAAASIG